MEALNSRNKTTIKVAKISASLGLIGVIITGLFTVYNTKGSNKEPVAIHTEGQQGGTNIITQKGDVHVHKEPEFDSECLQLKKDVEALLSSIKSKYTNFDSKKNNPNLDYAQKKRYRDVQYAIEELDRIKNINCLKNNWNRETIVNSIDNAKQLINE